MQYNSTIRTGFANSFWSTVALFNIGKFRRKKRVNTDHTYPLPMNKFAIKREYTENSPEKKPDDTTDKEPQGDSNSQTEQKSEKQNDDKIEHTVILPVFAVSTNEKKQQFLAASLGSNSFTKNSIFYKKDGLIKLFYQNPDVDQQNNKLEGGNGNELIIDGNGMRIIIDSKKEPITIIDGKNEPITIIDGNEKKVIIDGKDEKEIKIDGKQIRVKMIIEKEINNKMKIDGNGKETIIIDDNKMRVKKKIEIDCDNMKIIINDNKMKVKAITEREKEINGNEKKIEINSNKVIGKVKTKIIIDGNKREIDRNEEEIDGNEEEINGNEEEIDGNEIDNDEKDKKIKIIIKDKIIRIFKEDQNKKKRILSCQYLQNQSVKLTLNSRYDKNKLGFKHNIPINPQATSIVEMCSALKLIIKQKEEDYKKNSEAETSDKYERLFHSIKKVASNIIEEAIKNPDNFRILDARFHRLHIPRQVVHYKQEPSYNFVFQNRADYDNEHPHALSIAINQETVEKLLDYYSTLAKENLNWMETVTQASPELIIKFPKSIIKLMKKEVFHSKEIPLDKSWEVYRPNNDLDEIQSFHVEFNLFDPSRQQEYMKSVKDKKNHIFRYRKTNLKYFQVPLPGLIIKSGFTSTSERIWNAVVDKTCDFFLNLILFERNHGDKSPFTKLIMYDKTGEIYDNPSIEAVVDFQWRNYAVLVYADYFGSFIAENSDNVTAQVLENNVTYPNFTIQQNVAWSDRSDNYYYFWDKSVEAVYFWVSGRWDQVTNWSFWPVDGVTVLASIFLVTLMQNILIEAISKLDHRALLQMRASLLIGYIDTIWQQRNIYYAISTEKWENLTRKEKNLDGDVETIQKLIKAHIAKNNQDQTRLNRLEKSLDRLENKLDDFFKRLDSKAARKEYG
ncbi:5698_t:CDS:2 [Ambispora gerdemannii]|uniref:5698_t:CDS:1 n=1 Tax=Ambispora gerdemannii TaxID=144530 RepID=A0A9N8YKE0_9GLOM|nr:5698_t:CDS:2 [Ambispora gerdemannii]